MLDEVSQSPKEGRFASPSRWQRGSVSPGTLQRGLSPVSAHSDHNIFHSGQRDAPSSKHPTDELTPQLEHGCSPVSVEGYPQEGLHLIQDERRDGNGRFSDEHSMISSQNERENPLDQLGTTTNIDPGEAGSGDEQNEDLRIHLLRLREQKVEQKLKQLEEESRETEIKLRSLDTESDYRDVTPSRKYWDEDEDDVDHKERRRDWAYPHTHSPKSRRRDKSPVKLPIKDRIRY